MDATSKREWYSHYMKKPFFILIIVIAVVAGAYVASRYSGKGEVQSEGTDVPQDEYVTHTSKEFSFEYPKRWFVYDYSNTEPFPIVQLTNYEIDVFVESPHAQGNYFKLEIVKLPNEKNLSLEKWIDDFMKSQESQPELEERKSFPVGNVQAIWQDEIVQGINHPVVYLSKDNSVYLFNFGTLLPDFSEELDRFLKSFQFIGV